MEMVKPGGHLIVITPMNNYAGHGFYQFSPELFYSALCAENGYAVEQMLIVQSGRWYAVANPSEVRSRIELISREPTPLFVTAKRTASQPIFERWPQQSDYSAQWATGRAGQVSPPAESRLKARLVKNSAALQALQWRWRAYKSRRLASLSNQKHFQPVDLTD
jgi:hypothetical protein